MQKLFKEVFPQETFRWDFLDENINQHYQHEKMARNQITIFTLIAIGIAALGLLGMISNKVVEKTKEIVYAKCLERTFRRSHKYYRTQQQSRFS